MLIKKFSAHFSFICLDGLFKLIPKPTREVEKVLANLFPQEEEILDTIRKLPEAPKTAQNLTRSGTSTLVKKEAIKPITQ